MRRLAARRCGVALPCRADAQVVASYVVTGDGITRSLTGDAGRCGARPRARARPHQHLHPLPQRAVSRGAFPGRSRAQSGRRRQPLVRGSASAAAGRRLSPQSRNDHAVLLSRGRDSIASARHGAASRSCQPSKSRISWRISQRCANRKARHRCADQRIPRAASSCGLAGGAAVIGAVPIVTLRPTEATPAMLASAIRNVVGNGSGTDRQGQARHAAAGRKRQHRADDRERHEPDDSRRLRQEHPRFQREKPAAEYRQFLSRPARRPCADFDPHPACRQPKIVADRANCPMARSGPPAPMSS